MNTDVELDELLSKLGSIGYVPEQIVASPGEFSIRGGIIDIYPITEKYPVRIELFDVEVDSIRSFDAETQRSIRQLDEVYIPPVTEMILPKELCEGGTNRIKKAY